MDELGPNNGSESRSLISDADAAVVVRTFLIADIRGYTRFTAERGDEAAGRLASSFARLTRDEVEAGGGQMVELRGDEALVAFNSTRQAIRAALALQRRYAAHSESNVDEPLGVGIGIDAGEAVAVEGGYRGGALNLAARLCSIAGPGHILASEAVTHLARKVEGAGYVDRGAKSFKGLEQSVRVVEIVSSDGALVPSSAPLIETGVAAAPRVPFADLADHLSGHLSNRIEMFVHEQLQRKLARTGENSPVQLVQQDASPMRRHQPPPPTTPLQVLHELSSRRRRSLTEELIDILKLALVAVIVVAVVLVLTHFH